MNLKLKSMILAALFAALAAVCAQIAIPHPFSPVPFTLQIFAVFFSGALLGGNVGALSQVIYLMLGAIGLPVFAQFQGGLWILTGPTGGYLIAYPIAAFIIGKIVEKKDSFGVTTFSIVLGLIVIYILGTAQLKFVNNFSWKTAYLYGVGPFIVIDLIKGGLAAFISVYMRKVLKEANLLLSQ